MIEKIIDKHISLFGNNPVVNKINIGFTNTIYNVNDLYIVKICTDIDNEEKFKREIDFYNSNKNNNYIPKLYYSSTDKKDVPYYYEIIEKLNGVSLYEVWHTYSEEERENIIRQLCDIMKMFHSNKGNKYDWSKYVKEEFDSLYTKSRELNLFNGEEIELLEKAYSNFDKYLESNEFVLVHNDLHFDNIFIYDGKIKIIDFERSMYAPKDFDLGIFYRMIRKPWKFASEEAEKYTKLSDYKNIMKYVEEYYPELMHMDNLYKRLAIYDMVYFLKHYVNNPTLIEEKEDVLNAAKLAM